MCFMFVTTFTAAWKLIFIFRGQALKATTAAAQFNLNLDAVLVAIMLALAAVVLVDMVIKWYGLLRKPGEAKVLEVVEYA
jgi:carbon starvation protein